MPRLAPMTRAVRPAIPRSTLAALGRRAQEASPQKSMEFGSSGSTRTVMAPPSETCSITLATMNWVKVVV